MLWISEHKVAGPFIICPLTTLTVVLMGPYTVFAVGSGYAFKKSYENTAIAISIGTVTIFIGAYLGALIAFPIGRFMCRTKVKSFI